MWITAEVKFDTDEQAREAERLVREDKLAGISADLGNVTSTIEVLAVDDSGLPSDWLETVEKGEIVGGTLLPMPAFGDARIVVNSDGTMTAWILPEGVTTSDRRSISPGALEWRDPAPLMFLDQRTELPHVGAVFVGNLSNFRRSELAMVAAFNPDPQLFVDPMLPAVTKPYIEEGHYMGHGAQWGVCHLLHGCSITAPESKTNYSYARWKEVGDITGVPIYLHPKGDHHAPTPTLNPLTVEQTRAWYEENCSLEGLVEVGEDANGIWVSGAASPEIDGMFLSGDWRTAETPDGPNLELVAFLACTRPAFPLALVASDIPVALVAAGVVTETEDPDPRDEIIRRLASEIIALRTDVEPLVFDREARILLDSLI